MFSQSYVQNKYVQTIIKVVLSQYLKCKQRLTKCFFRHDAELRARYGHVPFPEYKHVYVFYQQLRPLATNYVSCR